jgi:peptidyl-prolyl cis-trans isomerase B (cyclophilin B)
MTQVQFNTSKGSFIVELNAEKAPQTVANFLAYVEKKHYNNTIFHRIINGFMVQGGGMTADMKEKSTDLPIKNEANNGLKNDKYTIAMARTSAPHSATAQFFINVANNDFLNFSSETMQGWGYAVFGKVISGTEVIEEMKKEKTGNKAGHSDVPVTPIIIESVVAL